MNDIVICQTEHGGKTFLTAAYYKDMQLSLVRLHPVRENGPLSGTVCIGRAENLQKNIGSTYIRIGDALYYLSGKSVRPGTELPVQITKPSKGGKRANVDTRLSLTGRNCIVSADPSRAASAENGMYSYSRKFSVQQKEMLREWIKEIPSPRFSVMLRTNAAFSSKEEVLGEIKGLCGQMSRILDISPTRTCFSVLYEPLPEEVGILMDIRGEKPDRIVTDREELFEKIRARLKQEPWAFGGLGEDQIVLYRDERVPLPAVYNLNRDVSRLFEKKVFLRSGAYLVIEKTEAFVSIDVNTGKCQKGKDPGETYFAVNLEAAKEAARQILLRNLSGMILIDFINLKEPEHREALLTFMRGELQKDPLRSEAVDLTKLGIMEIVRARKDLSLMDL